MARESVRMILKLYDSYLDNSGIEVKYLNLISSHFKDKEYSKTINIIRIVPIITQEIK